MKTMTCKQLGGACNEEFHAETFEGMAELSKKHGVEMAERVDEDHIKVMGKMKERMTDPEAMKEWIQKRREEFDALPEDE